MEFDTSKAQLLCASLETERFISEFTLLCNI